MEYFAFGETFVEEHKNSINSPFKFNGKELDEESGLYYYGARYYDPRLSIWASVDPLADYNPHMNYEHYIDGEHNDGVFNSYNSASYSYCYQNPIRYVDPDGKQVDIIDFIPFVGSSRDIYRGIRDGDWVTLGIGIGGLALDIGTLGAGSIATGISKTAIKQSIKVIAEASSKQLIKIGTEGAVKQVIKPVVKKVVQILEGEGVYELITTGGKYIGQSKNFLKRVADHFKKGGKLFDFKKITEKFHLMEGSTPLEREIYEQFLINKAGISNLLNKVNPVGGRYKLDTVEGMKEFLKEAAKVIEKYKLPK